MGKPLGDRFTWKPGDIEVAHSICGFCKFYDTCESELKNNRIEALRCENLILDNTNITNINTLSNINET